MKIQNQSRGLRNNNPGNIRRNYANNWKGLSDVQSDISFCQFISLEYGIRALMKLLLTYEKKGYNTINTIIPRYAPSSENDTNSYISFVVSFFKSQNFGYCNPDIPLNFSSSIIGCPSGLSFLVRAICKMESNYDPSELLLAKSYSML